jgi:hypothetical protein
LLVVGQFRRAMAAGVTDRLWDVSDIITILEARERLQAA